MVEIFLVSMTGFLDILNKKNMPNFLKDLDTLKISMLQELLIGTTPIIYAIKNKDTSQNLIGQPVQNVRIMFGELQITSVDVNKCLE